jgi:hypothetical protein
MSTLQSPKIEEALERAFRKHEAESFATDAALVAAVVVKHHGDDAGRVLELATQIARETKASFEPRSTPFEHETTPAVIEAMGGFEPVVIVPLYLESDDVG